MAKLPKIKFDLVPVLEAVRSGSSLYAACLKAGVSTQEFYTLLAKDEAARDGYRLALSDYADACTDEIRTITGELKAGNIDTSTAKLLIETEKWLAQKACPEPLWDTLGIGVDANGEVGSGSAEIVVKFV